MKTSSSAVGKNNTERKKDVALKCEMKQNVKAVLEREADAFCLPAEMEDRIMNTWMERKSKNRKVFSLKRAAVIGMAATLMVGTVCFATSKVVSIVSTAPSGYEYTEFNDLYKAEKEVGVESYAPENFKNGYEFEGIRVINTKTIDENGKKVQSYKELEVSYEKENEQVDFQISPNKEIYNGIDQENMFEQDGTSFSYIEILNKFVPEDYEPTEQEMKEMEEGKINIAYSDEEKISEEISRELSWSYEGKVYTLFLMGDEPALEKQDLLDMALEVIENMEK